MRRGIADGGQFKFLHHHHQQIDPRQVVPPFAPFILGAILDLPAEAGLQGRA